MVYGFVGDKGIQDCVGELEDEFGVESQFVFDCITEVDAVGVVLEPVVVIIVGFLIMIDVAGVFPVGAEELLEEAVGCCAED